MPDTIKTMETPPAPVQTPESAAMPNQEAKETLKPRETAPQAQEAKPNPSVAQHQGQPKAQDNHISQLKDRVATPHTKSERLIEIEKIMTNNLDQVYSKLDAQTQAMVKAEGEKTANKIETLIEQGTALAKGVLGLIRGWLNKIPGMNKFFLEQESKLKTDKIMAIERKTNLSATEAETQ